MIYCIVFQKDMTPLHLAESRGDATCVKRLSTPGFHLSTKEDKVNQTIIC